MTAAPEHWFFHLERSSLNEALPALLEKTRARDWRALVVSQDPARIAALDDALWTFSDASFLAHGRSATGSAERQPVLLTTAAENQNRAQAVFLLDGASEPQDLTGVERIVVVFDGADANAVDAARTAWKTAKEASRETAYWRQTGRGSWEKAG